MKIKHVFCLIAWSSTQYGRELVQYILLHNPTKVYTSQSVHVTYIQLACHLLEVDVDVAYNTCVRQSVVCCLLCLSSFTLFGNPLSS